ncbi:Cysteine-rich receptor-like protein [Vigna angularis]|uniref:Cysteine-rich receptor-like protein n=1 Tax=Phaseolus angularis TaxID=3914 RepID=A0A8T0JW63_PHAAN|nr:Cysteine-rich receptor-like protein [Vigna angularis]
MASYNIFLLSILVSFLSFTNTQAQSNSDSVYLYHNCSGGNTTDGSIFQSNLKILLSSLSDNAIESNGFYNSAYGENPSDSVFGLFMCRGDVPSQLCQLCVQNATQRLSSECSLAKQAVIWYDECTVRYSNNSFFSTFSIRPRLGMYNIANISNQESFMNLLFQTINETADAAAAAAVNKFATRKANISGFQSLYCLAQCTRDLSPSDCRSCLSGVIGDLPWCCQGKQGGRVLYPSCNVRYELYPFYGSTSEDSQLSEDPIYLNHNCSTNVTDDRDFKIHLSTLLSYMSSNATNQMDYKDVVEDTVYGLFMCRGDLPSPLCHQCVLNATHIISSECNSFQEAVIWYSHCMLRYSYRHFFSQVENSPPFQMLSLINTFNDVQEQSLFTYTLSTTLYNLSEAAKRSTARYVTKSSLINDAETLYVLAQCTQDLSSDNCSLCLEDINKNMSLAKLGNTGGRVLYPSCNLRYEFFKFYRDPPWQTPGNSSPPLLKGTFHSSIT